MTSLYVPSAGIIRFRSRVDGKHPVLSASSVCQLPEIRFAVILA